MRESSTQYRPAIQRTLGPSYLQADALERLRAPVALSRIRIRGSLTPYWLAAAAKASVTVP